MPRGAAVVAVPHALAGDKPPRYKEGACETRIAIEYLDLRNNHACRT